MSEKGNGKMLTSEYMDVDGCFHGVERWALVRAGVFGRRLLYQEVRRRLVNTPLDHNAHATSRRIVADLLKPKDSLSDIAFEFCRQIVTLRWI